MTEYFSPKLQEALAHLKPEPREALTAELARRTRDEDIYEILLLLAGFWGAAHLYLGDARSCALRLSLVGVFLALLVAGFLQLSLAILGCSLALFSALLALWGVDYFQRRARLARYHARLEQRVLKKLRRPLKAVPPT